MLVRRTLLASLAAVIGAVAVVVPAKARQAAVACPTYESMGLTAPIGPPPPPPPPPPPGSFDPSRIQIITNPQWLVRPTVEQMQAVYPTRLFKADVAGRATLECKVRVDQTLTDCRIAAETPPDRGFGAAALKVVPFIRMRPRTINGEPCDGAMIKFTLAWSM